MTTIITNNTAGWDATDMVAVRTDFDKQLRLAVRREMMAVETEDMLLQFIADLVQTDPEFKAKYTAFRAARLMGVK
jgi:hypothetical protein